MLSDAERMTVTVDGTGAEFGRSRVGSSRVHM